jgi:hypothetical protein
MAGSLPVATTAESSEKVAVVGSGEVGKSAVHSSYNNGPRTLLWGVSTLTAVEFCELGFSFYEKVSAMQIEF